MLRASVLTLALAALSATAQPPPRYAETVDVPSVLVDVRVLDDRGAPLLGLEQSDFQVSTGGKNVRVQSAAWIDGCAAPVDTSPDPPHASVPDRPPSGRLIVFLIQATRRRIRVRSDANARAKPRHRARSRRRTIASRFCHSTRA